MKIYHTPVMTDEALYFMPENADIAIDCTLGEGGHSLLMLEKGLTVYGFDRDESILSVAKERLSSFEKFHAIHGRYDNLTSLLPKDILGKADFMLFDLGVSMFHFKNSGRGFSFNENTPLDMALGLTDKTAFDVVNGYSEKELTDVFEKYGEVSYAKNVSKAIILERKKNKIETTDILEDIVFHATPKAIRHEKTHPATKVFQAIRIEVNDEMNVLERALSFIPSILREGGRAVFISYHSLEDRIVKSYVKQNEKTKNKDGFLISLTKHVIAPSEKEISQNNASRSAKLRAIELYKKE